MKRVTAAIAKSSQHRRQMTGSASSPALGQAAGSGSGGGAGPGFGSSATAHYAALDSPGGGAHSPGGVPPSKTISARQLAQAQAHSQGLSSRQQAQLAEQGLPLPPMSPPQRGGKQQQGHQQPGSRSLDADFKEVGVCISFRSERALVAP